MKLIDKDLHFLRRLFPDREVCEVIAYLIANLNPEKVLDREDILEIEGKKFIDITGCLLGDETFVDYIDCMNLPFVYIVHAIFGNQYRVIPRSEFKVLNNDTNGRRRMTTYDTGIDSTFTVLYEYDCIMISFDLDTLNEFVNKLSEYYSFSEFLIKYLSNKIVDQFIAKSTKNGMMFHRKATLDYNHILIELIHALTDDGYDLSLDNVDDVSTQLDEILKKYNK